MPSESTRVRERQERLQQLEEKQEDINKRLEASRAEERRLRREYESSRTAWERRAEQAQDRGEQAIELAQSVEGELRQQLDLKEQELQLALAENQFLEDQLEQSINELDTLRLELDYLEQLRSVTTSTEWGATPWLAPMAPWPSRCDLSPAERPARGGRHRPAPATPMPRAGERRALSWSSAGARECPGIQRIRPGALNMATNCSSCSGCWPPATASRSWPVLQIEWQARCSGAQLCSQGIPDDREQHPGQKRTHLFLWRQDGGDVAASQDRCQGFREPHPADPLLLG